MGKHIIQALILLAVLQVAAYADNYLVAPFSVTLHGPDSTNTYMARWLYSDGSVNTTIGNMTIATYGPSFVYDYGGGVVHFSGRYEVGYWSDGFHGLYWVQNYPEGSPNPGYHGGYNSSGQAVDGAGQVVNADGSSSSPPSYYGKGILLFNDGKTDRVYTIQLKDAATGQILEDYDVTLKPGEQQVQELVNPTAADYTVTHKEYAVAADGTGAQVTTIVDSQGSLAPVASSGTDPSNNPSGPSVSSKGPPTTAPSPGATAPAVVGTPSSDTQSMLNALGAGRDQDKANGDQAHSDANGIRGDLDGIENKLQGAADDAMDGSNGNSTLLGAAQSLPGKMSTLYNDLLGVGNSLGIALSNDTASLNVTVSLGPWGSHLIDLDQYSAWWPVLRGLVMAVFSVWFCFETVAALKGAVS